MRGFEEITSQGRDLSQGGFFWPFLTQNAFSLARFAPPKLILAHHCGKNDGIDLF